MSLFNGCFFVIALPLESIQFKKQISNVITSLSGKVEIGVSSKTNYLVTTQEEVDKFDLKIKNAFKFDNWIVPINFVIDAFERKEIPNHAKYALIPSSLGSNFSQISKRIENVFSIATSNCIETMAKANVVERSFKKGLGIFNATVQSILSEKAPELKFSKFNASEVSEALFIVLEQPNLFKIHEPKKIIAPIGKPVAPIGKPTPTTNSNFAVSNTTRTDLSSFDAHNLAEAYFSLQSRQPLVAGMNNNESATTTTTTKTTSSLETKRTLPSSSSSVLSHIPSKPIKTTFSNANRMGSSITEELKRKREERQEELARAQRERQERLEFQQQQRKMKEEQQRIEREQRMEKMSNRGSKSSLRSYSAAASNSASDHSAIDDQRARAKAQRQAEHRKRQRQLFFEKLDRRRKRKQELKERLMEYKSKKMLIIQERKVKRMKDLEKKKQAEEQLKELKEMRRKAYAERHEKKKEKALLKEQGVAVVEQKERKPAEQNDDRKVFIGNIKFIDLEKKQVGKEQEKKIKLQRMKNLYFIFERFGKIQKYQNFIESKSYALIVYKERASVDKALNALTKWEDRLKITTDLKQLFKTESPLKALEAPSPHFYVRRVYAASKKPKQPRQSQFKDKFEQKMDKDKQENKLGESPSSTSNSMRGGRGGRGGDRGGSRGGARGVERGGGRGAATRGRGNAVPTANDRYRGVVDMNGSVQNVGTVSVPAERGRGRGGRGMDRGGRGMERGGRGMERGGRGMERGGRGGRGGREAFVGAAAPVMNSDFGIQPSQPTPSTQTPPVSAKQSAEEESAKSDIGNFLYVKIADEFDVSRAGKIVGMILDAYPVSELKSMIIDELAIEKVVKECIQVLDN